MRTLLTVRMLPAGRAAVPLLVLFGALLSMAIAAEEGFVDVFNGENLDGWVVDGNKTCKRDGRERPIWTVEDGIITCAGRGGGFLRYDKLLTDFVIHVEFNMCKGCNSGLGIRSVKYDGSYRTRPSLAGYEMQIVDDSGRNPNRHSSGSLYRYVAPKVNATRPAGEWNVVEIECRGPRIHITINGQTIHDLDQTTIGPTKNKPLSGYFSLQDHGRRIQYRNIYLKEL